MTVDRELKIKDVRVFTEPVEVQLFRARREKNYTVEKNRFGRGLTQGEVLGWESLRTLLD
jgi:hypothetical protein